MTEVPLVFISNFVGRAFAEELCNYHMQHQGQKPSILDDA